MLSRMETLRRQGVTDDLIAKAEAIFDATKPWSHTSAKSPFFGWLDKVQDHFLDLARLKP